MIAAGRLNAYVIRALIHFQQGELPKAEALLTVLLEKDPSHVQAHHTLGRVLVAAGDVEGGHRHLDQATELRNQLTRKEQQGLRLSAMSQALRAAWQRKDYDACDRFITEMLVEANPQQQSQLYQQLAALRTAQGRQQEAREALEKAKQLSVSTPP
jgi:tetratricopeptide (TPR) repeat protein